MAGRRSHWLIGLGTAVVLARAGAAGPIASPHPPGLTGEPPAPWRVVGLPAQRKPWTSFEVVALDGERVLRVEADRSYGNLVHALGDEAAAVHRLSWRWRLDLPLADADLRRREREDVALRVCASFDVPLTELPFVERQVLRAARAASAYALPTAALCYVWDRSLAPGTVLASPFTPRIRYVVLRGPEAPLQAWQPERRDLVADYRRAFETPGGTVPPLLGIAIGADADNTQGHSVAYLADLTLH